MTNPEGMVRTFPHEEPSSFETLGSQFSALGDVPNSDFGTESLDPDPRESQICLLGML